MTFSTSEKGIIPDYPFAHGIPLASGVLKSFPDDFRVIEELGFEPSGKGEHVLLRIRKTGQNTHWVIQQLANFLAIKPLDIGYCGLKDRQAVTDQWLSIYWPKADKLNIEGFQLDGVEILQQTQHDKKLRPGIHAKNVFEICLREIDQLDTMPEKITAIKTFGVPNYFAEQRFGRNGNNLLLADKLLLQRKKLNNSRQKSFAISAARALVFNQVLAHRVKQGNWNSLLAGDPLPAPSGPMWGRGRNPASEQTRNEEDAALVSMAQWLHGLEHSGLRQERRSLICQPENIQWHFSLSDRIARLTFALPPGQYATSVLRELLNYETPPNDGE